MDAMARATGADRRAAELDLLEQLRAGLASAEASQRTVGLLADTVVVTQQRAVDASWSAYSAGTTDLWRVFEATHTLYNEQIALTRARQGLAGAQARLLFITTRGDLLGVQLPEIKRSER
jgi:outer membrane protein TolC